VRQQLMDDRDDCIMRTSARGGVCRRTISLAVLTNMNEGQI
jgi:hypothetical protein